MGIYRRARDAVKSKTSNARPQRWVINLRPAFIGMFCSHCRRCDVTSECGVLVLSHLLFATEELSFALTDTLNTEFQQNCPFRKSLLETGI